MKKIQILFFCVTFLLTSSVFGHDPEGKRKHLMAGEHFKKMDTNDDKKVSKEEWQKFHDGFFQELDKDADGSVTLEELKEKRMEKKEKMKDKAKEKKKQGKEKEQSKDSE